MDAQAFADAVWTAIEQAKRDGVTDDEMVTELETIIAGLKGE